jgi:hypothetical protein
MVVKRGLLGTALAILLVIAVASPGAAQSVKLADGNDWQRSSMAERRAYLVGIANTLAIGNAYETKKLPGQDQTFIRQAVKTLQGTTLDRAVEGIDRWYKTNPSQLSKPVFAVVWREIAKTKPVAER